MVWRNVDSGGSLCGRDRRVQFLGVVIVVVGVVGVVVVVVGYL